MLRRYPGGQVRRVRRYYNLDAAFWLTGDDRLRRGPLRLVEQEVENKHLKLGMQMRFRFLHKKEGQVCFACFRKFDDNSRHIKEVRIAETRQTDVLGRN